MGKRVQDGRYFNAAPEALNKAVRYAFRRVNAKDVLWSEDNSHAAARIGFSWRSLGESVDVEIGGNGNVLISSSGRFTVQVFDCGKNRENIEQIFSWMEEYLEIFVDIGR